MNQNDSKQHPADQDRAAPAHPAGNDETEQDANARMTGEGDVQNTDDSQGRKKTQQNEGRPLSGPDRGANPGGVQTGHSDDVGGEEGTGPGRSTGSNAHKRVPAENPEKRSEEADIGVAGEQEGDVERAKVKRKNALADAGIASR